jgi:hypothetical protein
LLLAQTEYHAIQVGRSQLQGRFHRPFHFFFGVIPVQPEDLQEFPHTLAFWTGVSKLLQEPIVALWPRLTPLTQRFCVLKGARALGEQG